MTGFVQSVDERTGLVGANRLEVLLFTLDDKRSGRHAEWFGINVFKVREVMHPPEITRAPDMPDAVEGIVSIRGAMVPVIDLARYCGIQSGEGPKILMVTEYNKNVQGFLVRSVTTIERLSWQEVKAPPQMLANRMGGLVTAVAELEDGRLVMILDVEKVLAETAGLYDDDSLYEGLPSHESARIRVLFADDSRVARGQITKTLDRMGLQYLATSNGAEAWEKLNELAGDAQAVGRSITDEIDFVLTDVEMPEMDGYVLTRKLKEDPRFRKIPVIMHSSLSTAANQETGKRVGADAYVPKFRPQELAATLDGLIAARRDLCAEHTGRDRHP